jgi:hypothetical protein
MTAYSIAFREASTGVPVLAGAAGGAVVVVES